jgi:hypothetical protein
MMYFISNRRLIPVACPSSQQETPSDRVSFQTTVEGKVKALLSPADVGSRTWDIGVGLADPHEVAVLDELASGSWPNGLGFLPADAPMVNVLSPAASMLDPAVYPDQIQGGPVALGDGVVSARSLVSDPGALDVRVGVVDSPVIGGKPVSASAWVRGQNAYLLLQFLDVDGEIIRGNVSNYGSSNVNYERLSVALVAPDHAASVRLYVRAANGLTRPAVTWTTSPQDYGHGRMCEKAVVHGPSSNVIRAVERATYYRLSYTVQEVG